MSNNPFADPNYGADLLTDEEKQQTAAQPQAGFKLRPQQASNPFADPNYGAEPEGRGFLGHAKDLGISALKGAIAVPESIVGLADIPTGGRVGKFLENEGGIAGFRPHQAKDYLDQFHTDQHKQSQAEFAEAEGVGEKFGAAISNPALIANTVTESLPNMLGTAGAARAVIKKAVPEGAKWGSKAIPAIGSFFEGLSMAGMQASEIRNQTEDRLLSPEQSGYAAMTGTLGSLFGYFGGRAAQKLGIGDVDTLMATGIKPGKVAAEIAQTPAKSVPRRIIEGAIVEGLFEELPQSVSEQILQNLALDKDWSENVDGAAVMGTLAGAVMGGAAGGLIKPQGQGTGDIDSGLVQPTPTPDNPAPAPVERPNPSNGPISAAAAQMAPVQTAQDLGIQFPEQQDWSQYEQPAAKRSVEAERGYDSLDGLIATTERMGFTDEAAQLITARRLFQQADKALTSGNDALADQFAKRANSLYESATKVMEPAARTGEVVTGGDIGPYRGQPESSGSTYDAENVIYGEEPGYARAQREQAEAAREQRAADDFSARYGQEGRTPLQPDPAREGDFIQSGTITDESRRLPNQYQRPAQLEDNRMGALPEGTGQMDMGRERPERTFTPTPTEYEGVGRNVVERQAGADTLRLENRKTITQGEMIELTRQFREAVTTKPVNRTDEQKQLIKALPKLKQQVNAGDVQVMEGSAPEAPITQGEQPLAQPQTGAAVEQQGGDILQMFTSPTPEQQADNAQRAGEMAAQQQAQAGPTAQVTPEQQRDLNHVDGMIEKYRAAIERAQGKEYKDNATKVQMGDPDAMAGDGPSARNMSIGEINERKRKNVIRGYQQQIESLEKTKQAITEGRTTLKAESNRLREMGALGMARDLNPDMAGLRMKANGSPFASERAAQASAAFRDNRDYASVVPVDGGFAVQIDTQARDQAETQAAESAQAKSEQAKRRMFREPDTVNDDMLDAIALMGGIDRAEAEAEGIDPAVFNRRAAGIRPIFTRQNGDSFDGMAERLAQYGYLDARADRLDDLRTKLDQAINGSRKIMTPEGYEALAEKELAAEAQLQEEHAPLADDITSDEAWAGEAYAMAAEAGVPINVIDAILEQYSADPIATLVELNDAINEVENARAAQAGEGTQGRSADTEIPWNEPGNLTPEQTAEIFGAVEPEPLLTAYTEADLQAQADAQAAAEQTEAEARKRAEDKAAADAQVNDFSLTGSSRPADVAAAAGQNDMFGLGGTPRVEQPAPQQQVDPEAAGQPVQQQAETEATEQSASPATDRDTVLEIFRQLGRDWPNVTDIAVAGNNDGSVFKRVRAALNNPKLTSEDLRAIVSKDERKAAFEQGQQEASQKAGETLSDETTVTVNGITIKVPTIDQQLVDDYNRATHMGRGRDLNAELRSEAEGLLNELGERKYTLDTPEQKAEAKRLIEAYLQAQAEFSQWDARYSANNPSWIVTGRSGRNMDKANRANERHMDEYTKRVDRLQAQRDRIGDTLYKMRPQEVQENQALSADLRNITQQAGHILGYLEEGKNALVAETRKWASPKAHKLIERSLDADRGRTIEHIRELENTKAVQDAGGLAKVFGPLSKAGRLIRSILKDADQNTTAPQNEAKQSGENSDDLPPILQLTRTRYINQEAKAQGIKKGSPGYADAIARIEDEYEADLDKAYAAISFEQYNALNSDTPESLNRQAWEGLRVAFGQSENDTRFSRRGDDNIVDPEYTPGKANPFWEGLNNGALRRGSGNNRLAQRKWVEENLAAGSGYQRGQLRVVAGRAGSGLETIRFERGIAGFQGVVTSGRVSQSPSGKEAFVFTVTPVELLSSQGREGAAALTITLTETKPNQYEVGISGPLEGGAAAQALAGTEYLSDTGNTSQQGVKYLKLNIGNTATRSFLSEAVRRLAMHNGRAPDAVLYSARDTGARAGDQTVRKFGRDIIESKFSRETEAESFDSMVPNDIGSPISRHQVEATATRITANWTNAPEMVTVATDRDLPADLQETIDKQNARGKIDGVFHKGRFYLIADKIRTEVDVERIVLHEALGHYGLRQLYGPAFGMHMDRLFNRVGGYPGIQRLGKKYGFDLSSYWENAGDMSLAERREMMADELIAHIAGTGTVQPDLIQKIAHLIRKRLRKIMAGTRFAERLDQMTDVEVLRIVAAARKAVVEGESQITVLTHDPRFVRDFERVVYGNEGLLSSETNGITSAEKSESSQDLRFSRTDTVDQFDDLSDPQSSFLNKIGPKTTKERIRDRIAGVVDNIGLKTRQGMVDRYASLLELDKKAQGADVVENRTRFSSWVLSKMSHAADGALSAMLTHGRIQYADGVIDLKEGDNKGLLDVLKTLGSTAEIERFMGWIAANRSKSIMERAQAARDRAAAVKAEKANLQDMLKEPDLPPLKIRQINKAIKDADTVINREMDAAAVDERLFTPEEVAAGVELNQGETKEGKERSTLYKQVFAQFQQHRDDVLAIAEEAGIITPDNRQMWRDEFYVPFYRVMEEEGTKGPRISKGLSRQEAYKRLKGGTQEVNDLLENTLMNFQHLLSASLKNNAARQALENAEMVGIATRTTEAGRNKKSSTYVLDRGEKVWYDIEDDLVFESLSALSDIGSNTMSRRIMRSFKRTFTSFTTISPQFVVANTLRDALQSIAIGNMSYNAFGNVFKGAKAYGGPNSKGRTRGEMLASGAAFSFGHIYGAGDVDALKAGIQRQIKGARSIDSPKDVVHLWRAVWDQYTGYGDTMENSNRAAIYQQNLEKGKLYAAFQARDLMDFSSQGAWPAVKFLTDVVPFLNARLVGLDRLYRGGIKPSFNVLKHMMGGPESSITDRQAAQRFAIVVGSLTAATIALYLANADDERFKELEEWERDAYWHVWVGDQHFTIPKPFEIGAIATLAERSLEQMVDDTKDGKLFAERLGHILTDTFAFNPIPQAAKPMFDLYANKDSFTGRDIESLSMLRLSSEYRTRANTTDLAKWLAAATRGTTGQLSDNLVLSPVQVDFLIQGYLGWVGGMGASTVDVISKAAKGEERPDRAWYEYQPIRRFYRNDALPKSFTRYGTEFYDRLREVNMVYADIQNLRKLSEFEAAAGLMNANRGTLRYRQLMNKTQQQLSKINAQIKLAQANKNLSPEAKRARIDILTAQRNRLTQGVIERLEQKAG